MLSISWTKSLSPLARSDGPDDLEFTVSKIVRLDAIVSGQRRKVVADVVWEDGSSDTVPVENLIDRDLDGNVLCANTLLEQYAVRMFRLPLEVMLSTVADNGLALCNFVRRKFRSEFGRDDIVVDRAIGDEDVDRGHDVSRGSHNAML